MHACIHAYMHTFPYITLPSISFHYITYINIIYRYRIHIIHNLYMCLCDAGDSSLQAELRALCTSRVRSQKHLVRERSHSSLQLAASKYDYQIYWKWLVYTKYHNITIIKYMWSSLCTPDVEYVQKNAALKRAQLGYLDLQVPAGPSYFLMTNDGQCRSTLHIVQHYPTHYNPPSRVAPWPLICNPRYVISVAAFTGPQTKTRLNAAEAVGKAGGCHAAREIVKWYGNHWKIYENIAQFCKCVNTS